MNRITKLIIGIAISIAGLWYAFRGMNFSELIDHLSQTNFSFILLAMGIIVVSVALRAYRWQLMLKPIQTITFNPLFASTMIGYFGNSVLPFRLGELLRAYSISRKESITSSVAFGTIIMEHILDLMGLAAVMIFFAFFSPLMEWSGNVLIGLVALTVGGLGIIIWLGRSHSNFHERVVHWKIFEKSSGQKLLNSIQKIFKGLTSIGRTKHSGQLFLSTLALWVLIYASIILVVLATGININWVAVGIILIATSLAITVPSAPGYVGTYHAAAVYVLVNIYNVGLAESQAFAVLIHAIGFIPLVVIGFFYFLRSSIHISDLKTEEITT